MNSLLNLVVVWFTCSLVLCSSMHVSSDTPNRHGSGANPFVAIPHLGVVEGTLEASAFTRRSIYKFLGVNYALPPSGSRRFEPPQPFGSWEGIYNASLMRQACPQVNVQYYIKLPPHLVDEKNDTEDCLVVNVFTPKIPKTPNEKLLPVLVFVHGGSFYMGSAQDFGPQFLLEKDVVLVIPQYRLGVFGFSSLQTDSIAGNAGMLDIVLALEWVRDNIEWFGGDPTRITVAGQSAGAAAVTALLVSPLVPPGLISAAIVQSGSVEAPWAVSHNPAPALQSIAKSADCFSSDLQEIADCLRKTSVEAILKSHLEYIKLGVGESTKATSLVVQQAGAHRFLVEDPVASFEKGNFTKVPIMVGTTRDDGSAFLAELLSHIPLRTPYSRNMTKLILKVLTFQEQQSPIVDVFHEKYFKDAKTVQDATKTLYDLFGVFIMKAPTISIARKMYQFKPTFIYSFNFLGNVSKLRASEPDWDQHYPIPIGVAHSDELGYLFPLPNHTYSAQELQMVDTMVNLWTNFITHQQPVPTRQVKTWSPMRDDFGPYLRIDQRPVEYFNVFKEYEVNIHENYAEPINGADSTTTGPFSSNMAIITAIIFCIFQNTVL